MSRVYHSVFVLFVQSNKRKDKNMSEIQSHEEVINIHIPGTNIIIRANKDSIKGEKGIGRISEMMNIVNDIQTIYYDSTELASLFMFYIMLWTVFVPLILFCSGLIGIIGVIVMLPITSFLAYKLIPVVCCFFHRPVFQLSDLTTTHIEGIVDIMMLFYEAVERTVKYRRFSREEGFVFWPWKCRDMFSLAFRNRKMIEHVYSTIKTLDVCLVKTSES